MDSEDKLEGFAGGLFEDSTDDALEGGEDLDEVEGGMVDPFDIE